MTIIGDKLSFFQDLYSQAKNRQGELFERFERNMAQYEGSRDIDGSHTPASFVRNITYELIEAQVSDGIPMPKVDPERLTMKTARNAKAVEELCIQLLDKLPIEELNDLDERRTYIFGGSAYLVEWDESIRTHDTVGGIRLTLISPTDIMPQPDCYSIKDMDYIFVRVNTSKEEAARRYGLDAEDLADAESDESVEHKDESNTITVLLCFYRNEEGNVCRFAWTGEVVLLDEEDYYSRHRQECRACGRRVELCDCAKPDVVSVPDDYEALTEAIPLQHSASVNGQELREYIPAAIPLRRADGSVVTEQIRKTVFDADGRAVRDPNSPFGAQLTEMVVAPKMVPNRIKYYKPRSFPIVIRKNISADKAFWGQSDCDTIRPQQQQINKLESRIQAKLMKAGVTPVLPDDAEVSPDNSVFGQVIRLKPGQHRSDFGVIDTQPNISQEIAQAERIYEQARRILGISDSYQGYADATATSGRAKEAQIAQSAGRLNSKRKMKYAAYADLFRVIFELHLAYSDEPRALAYRNELGEIENLQFSRFDFLMEDAQTGEWYYDDSYIFGVDLNGGIEQQRETM